MKKKEKPLLLFENESEKVGNHLWDSWKSKKKNKLEKIVQNMIKLLI